MSQRHGSIGPDGEDPEAGGPFGDGKLWIGRHAADQDILVFDPSEADASADPLALYSLSQHRVRSFPRSTVRAQIHPLEDAKEAARAKKDYERRSTLRDLHEETMSTARTERKERQRDGVLAAHRRYIEGIGLEYAGQQETGADHRPGRRTKCHSCGIALDDFAGTVCMICNGVLCSCGACACGSRSRQR